MIKTALDRAKYGPPAYQDHAGYAESTGVAQHFGYRGFPRRNDGLRGFWVQADWVGGLMAWGLGVEGI